MLFSVTKFLHRKETKAKQMDIDFRSGMVPKSHFHLHMNRPLGSKLSPLLCRAALKINHNTAPRQRHFLSMLYFLYDSRLIRSATCYTDSSVLL